MELSEHEMLPNSRTGFLASREISFNFIFFLLCARFHLITVNRFECYLLGCFGLSCRDNSELRCGSKIEKARKLIHVPQPQFEFDCWISRSEWMRGALISHFKTLIVVAVEFIGPSSMKYGKMTVNFMQQRQLFEMSIETVILCEFKAPSGGCFYY